MASLDVTGLDDVLRKLDKLSSMGEVSGIAKHAVEAAQPINERAVKAALAGSEHGPYATGSVSGSVSSTGVRENEYGVYAVARPTGHDSRGVRNGLKAAVLQYGAPHTPARPWREMAVASAESGCQKAMEGVIRKEMGLE